MRRTVHWHRRLGLAAAPVVLLLTLSGLALEHSETLGLEENRTLAPWLLTWYGATPRPVTTGWRAGSHWLSQVGDHLYLDAQALDRFAGQVRGAGEWKGLLLVAQTRRVLVFTADGRLVDIMDTTAGLPEPVDRLGTTPEGRPVVASGLRRFSLSDDLTAWGPTDDRATAWSRAEPLPDAVQRQLHRVRLGPGLSWERVMLDLHSGRLFGWGRWVFELLALVLLANALSGVRLWFAARRRR